MDIPAFDTALERMSTFLASTGAPSRLVWVFRDDLMPLWGNMVVGYPPPQGNEALARKVYEEGRARGLVRIDAVAASKEETFATVWYPRMPEDEVQGWYEGLKLAIRQPLPRADLVRGARQWSSICRSFVYRRYQKYEAFIGTRSWAAA